MTDIALCHNLQCGGARDLLRAKAMPESDWGLTAPKCTDAQWMDFIAQQSVFSERPWRSVHGGVRVQTTEKAVSFYPNQGDKITT